MKKQFTYSKLITIFFLLVMVNLAYGAFTGNIDDRKNKFSLKNLSSLKKTYSLFSLNTGSFHYNGSLDINHENNGDKMQVQSMIRMERGNTTYVYPYKYTYKVPKFVTPKAPINR